MNFYTEEWKNFQPETGLSKARRNHLKDKNEREVQSNKAFKRRKARIRDRDSNFDED